MTTTTLAVLALLSLAVTGTLAGPGEPDCANLPLGSYHADPYDCHMFYICGIDGPVHESCGPGLHYDPSIQACNYPSIVHCVPTPSPGTTTTTTTTTTSTTTPGSS